ncbi:UNKNOWN [Stylonychia lemnae]|uniref:Morn repeat protein n=1 Tax=Stylonychia lemnae TaxID=5949 RepID=A0A078AEG4_STYLE|nr:UNKNOWN [Stylonychia lemnae]|eukprot:CDW80231.1 UNKNOWN [Stylonychia lemnae]
MVKIVGMEDMKNLLMINSDIFEQPIEDQQIDESYDLDETSIFRIQVDCDEPQFQFEIDNDIDLNAFLVTINSSNQVINDTYNSLGGFSYNDLQLEPNPDRIFMPIIYGKDGQICEDQYLIDGLWENNKSNGHGQVVWNNGNYYIGEWKDDQSHGIGQFYNEEENKFYKGEQEFDQYNGLGKMIYNDGSIYYGQWESNQRSRFGVFIFPEGDSEER